MKRSFVLMVILVVSTLLLVNPVVAQVQDDSREDRVQDLLDEEKGEVKTPAEELIEMLKKRALRKVEEERRKQFWAFKGTIGLHMAYDNNVNTDSERRGDSYLEQYFSYSWVPTFNDYFGAEVGTWYFSDWYFDTADTTIIDNAFNASLKIYPKGSPDLEWQPGIERVYAYYPSAEDSSYVEDKAFFKFKGRFWKKWSQGGKYEFSFKEYDTKHPRLNTSSSYIMGNALEKKRHTLEYYVGFPAGKNNLKVKGKAYKETSNDAYIDYYDVYSYKGEAELGRSLTKKLYMKLSSAYERKNFCQRSTIASYFKAQYDDVYTQKLNFYYTIKKGWTLSYTLTYKKSDSSNATYDYDTMSHKAGIYISF